MPYVQAGDIRMHYIEQGHGPETVVFVHGNLGCVDWMDLVRPHLDPSLRFVALDWRGCGDSDKPEPEDNYANYSMQTHAMDLLAALDGLDIEHCHLANHSTGALICDYALLAQPGRFGRVLSLDPVAPYSIPFDEEGLALFQAMKRERNVAFAALATAAPSLFDADTLRPGSVPEFKPETATDQCELFNHLVDRTRELSDGIWFGTPVQLTVEHKRGELVRRLDELVHPRQVLWGEQDLWIPREHMDRMAKELPDCTLEVVPGVGHAMNVERPTAFAERFNKYFTNN